MRNPMVDVPTGLEALHREYQAQGKGGWREVGKLLKISGAYACQIAKGKRPITPKIARRYLELNLAPVKPARSGKPAHRPYITDPAKWAAYQRWSAEYDAAQEDAQP